MGVNEIRAKSILRKHRKIDSWFVSRYGMNLYRGCQHDCAYCDGRSEKYYVEGEFGTDVSVKTNAAEILRRELDPSRKRKPLKKGFVFIGGGVILAVAFPPYRLPHRLEDRVPGLGPSGRVTREHTAHHAAKANLTGLLEHIAPGLAAYFIPIEGRHHLKQHFLAAHLKGPFVNLIPHTGAGLINITMFVSRAAAWAVAHALGAFHRADEGGLLQEAVAAHPAAKQGAFDCLLDGDQQPLAERLFLEWAEGWLPAASWSEDRHEGFSL